MDLTVFAAVLLAALLHAGWSTMVKSKLDPFVSLTAVAAGFGVLAVPALFFVAPPAAGLWPYLIASVVVHLIYKICLSATYASGELGQVYPIARGSGPILTVLGAGVIAGEFLSHGQLAGALLIVTGVIMLSLKGSPHFNFRAVGLALATGVCIASYTLIDGLGVRAAREAGTFIAYLFVLDGLSMFLYAWVSRGSAYMKVIGAHWRLGLLGGAMALVAYAMNLWAMTHAPIGLVAALRESSVLFAVFFGVLFLKERLSLWRSIAAATVLSGIVFIKV